MNEHILDHVSIQCADVEASARFYDAFLGALGAKRIMEFGDVIGYGFDGKPEFWLGARHTGEGFRETHLGFAAEDRATVDAAFGAAEAAGAQVLHKPRLWPEYHPTYYGGFVRDPDGNNIEAVSHSPE